MKLFKIHAQVKLSKFDLKVIAPAALSALVLQSQFQSNGLICIMIRKLLICFISAEKVKVLILVYMEI